MRRLLWPLGLAAAWLSPASLHAQSTLTLEQVLDRGSSQHPRLTAAHRQLEAATAAAAQADTGRNPVASAIVEDARHEGRTTSYTVDIPLELGGKRQARVRAAAQEVGLATAELARVRTELRALMVGAFFRSLLAQQRVELAASSVRIAEQATEAVDRRVDAGKVSPVDATRARVDLSDAQLELAQARAEQRSARHSLALAMGDGEPGFDTVDGPTLEPPSRPALAELVPLLDSSPALTLARLELERRQALVELERSKGWPDLSLSLGSKYESASGRSQAIVGLSLSLPLMDRNQGAILEASRRADKAREDWRDARLSVLDELQQACERLALTTDTLRALQDTLLPAALDAYQAAGKGYEAGKFGFLDVIDAQRALLQARTRYLNTLATAHQAAVQIDRITGR